ncbi:hypothetical protein ACFW1A_13515 [Kitasatospora sp. NPDC058965]|uniref:hypothetical protein n=1 Tax=Kitasatospora sp. NPDC058965 TaxID=3346682 RepID=UPI003679F818
MSPDTPAADTPSDGLSRRLLIRRAAAVGAAGLAVSLAAGAGSAGADPADPAPADAGDQDGAAAPEHAEPMIIHVRDARTGHLDLFSGERHHRVQDPKLAAALVRALG